MDLVALVLHLGDGGLQLGVTDLKIVLHTATDVDILLALDCVSQHSDGSLELVLPVFGPWCEESANAGLTQTHLSTDG